MEKKNGCCCEKHTDRPEEQKKKLQNRLKRIEGQIRGIQAMLDRDAYCNDILIQSADGRVGDGVSGLRHHQRLFCKSLGGI